MSNIENTKILKREHTHFLILSDPLMYIRVALIKIRMVKCDWCSKCVKGTTLTEVFMG